MPKLKFTSPNTGQEYSIDFDGEPNEADIVHVQNELDRREKDTGQSEAGAFAAKIPQTIVGDVIGGLVKAPGAVASIVPGMEDNALVKAGEGIKSFAEDVFPVNPAFEGEASQDVASAIGQAAGMLIPVTGARALGAGAKTLQAVGLGEAAALGATGGYDVAEQFDAQGVPDRAWHILGGAAREVGTEMLGGFGGRSFSKALAGDISTVLKGQPGKAVAKTIAGEAGEEALAGAIEPLQTRAGVLGFNMDAIDPSVELAPNGRELPNLPYTLEGLKDVGWQGLMGAVGGAVFAVPQYAALKTTPKLNQALPLYFQTKAHLDTLQEKGEEIPPDLQENFAALDAYVQSHGAGNAVAYAAGLKELTDPNTPDDRKAQLEKESLDYETNVLGMSPDDVQGFRGSILANPNLEQDMRDADTVAGFVVEGDDPTTATIEQLDESINQLRGNPLVQAASPVSDQRQAATKQKAQQQAAVQQQTDAQTAVAAQAMESAVATGGPQTVAAAAQAMEQAVADQEVATSEVVAEQAKAAAAAKPVETPAPATPAPSMPKRNAQRAPFLVPASGPALDRVKQSAFKLLRKIYGKKARGIKEGTGPGEVTFATSWDYVQRVTDPAKRAEIENSDVEGFVTKGGNIVILTDRVWVTKSEVEKARKVGVLPQSFALARLLAHEGTHPLVNALQAERANLEAMDPTQREEWSKANPAMAKLLDEYDSLFDEFSGNTEQIFRTFEREPRLGGRFFDRLDGKLKRQIAIQKSRAKRATTARERLEAEAELRDLERLDRLVNDDAAKKSFAELTEDQRHRLFNEFLAVMSESDVQEMDAALAKDKGFFGRLWDWFKRFVGAGLGDKEPDLGRIGNFLRSTQNVLAEEQDQIEESTNDAEEPDRYSTPVIGRNQISKVSDEDDHLRVGSAKLGTEKKPVFTPNTSNIGGDIVPDDLLERQMEKVNYGHMPSSVRKLRNAKRKRDAMKEWLKKNLRALHDAFPKEYRARATHWYDGANRLAKQFANKYGYSVEQASAVMAALSPQKDWFANVAQAWQVMDLWSNHQDTVMTEDLIGEQLENIITGAVPPKKQLMAKAKNETPEQKAERVKFNKDLKAKAIQDRRDILKDLPGKTLRSLEDNPVLQGWAVRVLAQSMFGQNYNVISPEGDVMQLETNDDGSLSKHGWGSVNEIEKSIRILKNGSIQNISNNLSDEHKVRNFYNNIVAPNSPNEDVTIDTHAVAAAHLMPFAASSIEVLHNFGGGGIGSSGVNGVSGTYHIYIDAYRELAKDLGIQPRQLQSITWEAVRLLFPWEQKDKSSLALAAKEWQIGTEDEARTRIAGRELPPPTWGRPGSRVEPEGVASPVQGEVRKGAEPAGGVRDGDRGAAGTSGRKARARTRLGAADAALTPESFSTPQNVALRDGWTGFDTSIRSSKMSEAQAVAAYQRLRDIGDLDSKTAKRLKAAGNDMAEQTMIMTEWSEEQGYPLADVNGSFEMAPVRTKYGIKANDTGEWEELDAGSEGIVIENSKVKGVVYKVYLPWSDDDRSGMGLVSEMKMEDGVLVFSQAPGTMFDPIAKARFITGIGGVPQEFHGIDPDGYVVTKMPRGTPVEDEFLIVDKAIAAKYPSPQQAPKVGSPEYIAEMKKALDDSKTRLGEAIKHHGLIRIEPSDKVKFTTGFKHGAFAAALDGKAYIVTDVRMANVLEDNQQRLRVLDAVIVELPKQHYDKFPEIQAAIEEDKRSVERGEKPRHEEQFSTPKQDVDYLAAVERGDMETAQRMVDEAAKAAGYTPATAADIKNARINSDQYRKGEDGHAEVKSLIWYRDNAFPLSRISDAPSQQWFKDERQAWAEQGEPDRFDDMLEPIKTPITVYDDGSAAFPWDGNHRIAGSMAAGRTAIPAVVGINIRDAQGNVIPLSQRFNPATPDIQFSTPLASKKNRASVTEYDTATEGTGAQGSRGDDIRKGRRDGSVSRRRKAPDPKGAPKGWRGKRIQLTHWSGYDNLKRTDPSYHGTGGLGKERDRKKLYAKDYQDRTYFGFGRYLREDMIGGERYTTELDGSRLYDFRKDHLGLYPDMAELRANGYAPFDKLGATTIYEKKIKEAGYSGYVSEAYQAVAMFDPMVLKKVENSNKSAKTIVGDSDPEQFSSRRRSPQNIDDVITIIRENKDGFTVSFKGEFPDGGYAVAPSKATEFALPENFTRDMLIDYYEKHEEIASLEGANLGGWFDKQAGNYILDISFVLENKDDALRVAKWAKQDAIFDLFNFNEIRTPEDFDAGEAPGDIPLYAQERRRNKKAVGRADGRQDDGGAVGTPAEAQGEGVRRAPVPPSKLDEQFDFVVERDNDDEGTFVVARSKTKKNALGGPLDVAHLHVPDDNQRGEKWYAGDVYVAEEHRKKGVARRMYQIMADHLGKPPEPASLQSPDAVEMWKNFQFSTPLPGGASRYDRTTWTDNDMSEWLESVDAAKYNELVEFAQVMGTKSQSKYLRESIATMADFAKRELINLTEDSVGAIQTNPVTGDVEELPPLDDDHVIEYIKLAKKLLKNKTFAKKLRDKFQKDHADKVAAQVNRRRVSSAIDAETGELETFSEEWLENQDYAIHKGSAVVAVMQLELMNIAQRLALSLDTKGKRPGTPEYNAEMKKLELMQLLMPAANDTIIGDYMTMRDAARALNVRAQATSKGFWRAMKLIDRARRESAISTLKKSGANTKQAEELIDLLSVELGLDKIPELLRENPLYAKLGELLDAAGQNQLALEAAEQAEEDDWWSAAVRTFAEDERAILEEIRRLMEEIAADSKLVGDTPETASMPQRPEGERTRAQIKAGLDKKRSRVMGLINKLAEAQKRNQVRAAKKLREKLFEEKKLALLKPDAQARKIIDDYVQAPTVRAKKKDTAPNPVKDAFVRQVRNPVPKDEFVAELLNIGVPEGEAENLAITASEQIEIKKQRDEERGAAKAQQSEAKKRERDLEKYYADIAAAERKEADLLNKIAAQEAKSRAKALNKIESDELKQMQKEAAQAEREKQEALDKAAALSRIPTDIAQGIIDKIDEEQTEWVPADKKMEHAVKRLKKLALVDGRTDRGVVGHLTRDRFISDYTAAFEGAGVDSTTAYTLASRLYDENIKLLANKAYKKSVSAVNSKKFLESLIKNIYDTPISAKASGTYAHDQAVEAFRAAGLTEAQAKQAAEALGLAVRKAQEKAQLAALERAAKRMSLKGATVKNIQDAIRAVPRNPADPALSALAQLFGFKELTLEDYKALAEADEMTRGTQNEQARGQATMLRIMRKSDPPKAVMDMIFSAWVPSAISGASNYMLNTTSPLFTSVRNNMVRMVEIMTDAARGKTNFKQTSYRLGRIFSSFTNSMREMVDQLKFSAVHDAYKNRMAEHVRNLDSMVGQGEKAIEMFNEGVKEKDPLKILSGSVRWVYSTVNLIRRSFSTIDQAWASGLARQSFEYEAYREMMANAKLTPDEAALMMAEADTIARDELLKKQQARAQSGLEAMDRVTANAVRNDLFHEALMTQMRNQHSIDMEFKTFQREGDMELGNIAGEDAPIWDLFNNAIEAIKRGAVAMRSIGGDRGKSNPYMVALSHMITGFISVPANVLNRSFYFTPIGIARAGYKLRQFKKDEVNSHYSETMETRRQAEIRMTESLIGTALMLAYIALKAAGDDDDEWDLTITGAGPKDKELADAWLKKGNRRNAIQLKTPWGTVALPWGRGGFEGVAMQMIPLAAIDDMQLNGIDPAKAANIGHYAGSFMNAFSSQGKFFGMKTAMEGFMNTDQAFVSRVTYSFAPFVPWSGLLKSLTKAVGEDSPMDKSSPQTAFWMSTPVAGFAGTARVNVFGDQFDDLSWLNRAWVSGFPASFSTGTSPSNDDLYSYVLRTGLSPSAPVRSTVERANGPLSDEQWFRYAETRGKILKDGMRQMLPRLKGMSRKDAENAITNLAADATLETKSRMGLK